MSETSKTAPNPLRENEEGLFGVQWHITDNCDQRCRHCYIFAEDNKKPLVSMDLAQMQEVIQKVEAFLGRMDMRPNWHITGGDPLLCPDFWKLAELMKENKLDGISEGTRVKIGFVIDGREWTDPKTGKVRYFSDLTALRLERLDGEMPVPEVAVPDDVTAELDNDMEIPF